MCLVGSPHMIGRGSILSTYKFFGGRHWNRSPHGRDQSLSIYHCCFLLFCFPRQQLSNKCQNWPATYVFIHCRCYCLRLLCCQCLQRQGGVGSTVSTEPYCTFNFNLSHLYSICYRGDYIILKSRVDRWHPHETPPDLQSCRTVGVMLFWWSTSLPHYLIPLPQWHKCVELQPYFHIDFPSVFSTTVRWL